MRQLVVIGKTNKIMEKLKGLAGTTLLVFLLCSCAYSQTHVGFKQLTTPSGLLISVWYPSKGQDSSFIYTKSLVSRLAFNGPAPDTCCLPLIVFSHGFTGCGIQSVFLTEELARAGYIVAAPDHKDASCRLQSMYTFKMKAPDVPFATPGKWSEETYRNRRNDMDSTIRYMIRRSEFASRIDSSRIGAAGHSLGGYTVFGLAGGWDSWKDSLVKAVLVFSPYLSPYNVQNRIKRVNIPVMYQGAELDLNLSPEMSRKNGLYEQSNSPKYYVELPGGSHFEWSNVVCMGERNVADCLEKNKNARLINDYSIAFFDNYLKGKESAVLKEKIGKVKDFRFSE
jgi:predicted dienelactone hydrolase